MVGLMLYIMDFAGIYYVSHRKPFHGPVSKQPKEGKGIVGSSPRRGKGARQGF